MKTPCCLESVNKCPNNSSCPMILRSACSHGHSHKSLASDEAQIQNLEKRTYTRKSRSDRISETSNSKRSYESFLETSLKRIALKSTTTFSILKENLYNHLEFAGNEKTEVFEQNGKNLGRVTGHSTIKTSTPISSLLIKDNFFSTKNLIGNDHSFESIDNSVGTMSGRVKLQRNALRVLSESDTDEESYDNLESRVKLRRTSRSLNTVTHRNSSTEAIASPEATATEHRSSNHVNSNNFLTSTSFKPALPADSAANYNNWSSPNCSPILNHGSSTLNSSQIDRSSVQESMLDRLRWIVWRYVYLKIIQSIGFDVWLLSRLRGSRKTVAILLLPLLLYLFYSAVMWDDGLTHESSDLTSSPLSSYSLFSLLTSPFEISRRWVGEAALSCSTLHTWLPSLSAVSSFLSSMFVTRETTQFLTKPSTPHVSSKSSVESLNVEQHKSLAVEALEERLSDLEKKIQVSHTQNMKDVKGGTAVLQGEIADLRNQFKTLSVLFQQFQTDIEKLEKSSSTKDVETLSAEHKMNINLLNTKMKAFEEKLGALGTLKRCCDQKWDSADFIASIEKHLVAAFGSVVDGDKSSSYHFFSEWLNSKFIDPKTVASEIELVSERLQKEQSSAESKRDVNNIKVIEGVVQHYIESLKADMTVASKDKGFIRGSLSSEDFRKIVKEAIILYDADKIGLVDYALESGGGSVLSIRCSESYSEKKAKFSLLGFPLWSDQNSPRTAIQPDVQPGNCWSFKGSQGFLVIELSYEIRPTGFTLEHIPLSLSPTGSIDSAPKDFSVWGLASETDNEGTLLGNYSYDDKGEPLQYFKVQNITSKPFSYVELKIHSNHGNLEYTCLYRFRVHGTRAK